MQTTVARTEIGRRVEKECSNTCIDRCFMVRGWLLAELDLWMAVLGVWVAVLGA